MDPETHDTLCIACNLCAIACPEDCIDVIPMDVEIVVAGKPRRKKVLDEFIFDTSRCMFCALCQEACPTSCLELTQDFELATYSRAGFVWNREMLEQGRETVKGIKHTKCFCCQWLSSIQSWSSSILNWVFLVCFLCLFVAKK
jgi:NADH-quinone oxidoreductase subunit I